ncbi:MAG: hypothetical protein ACRD2T_07830 [Thermoanaerobaculia bacterium]
MEDCPECLERSSFAGLREWAELITYRLQPWPTFVGAAKLAEMGRVAVGLDGLIKSLPRRLFHDDPARLAEFYQIDSPLLAAVLVEPPNGVAGALSRGDFLETAGGLRCLEWNCGSNLGGWRTQAMAGLCLRQRPIAEFLSHRGVAARPRNTIRLLFERLVEQAIGDGTWTAGPLNLAIVVRPARPTLMAEHSAEIYGREYAALLRERGEPADGQIFLCGYEDLRERDGAIAYRDEPVHAVLEQQEAPTARHVFRAFKAGRVSLFSGPITGILSDKRNLALLFERGGELAAEERELVRAHVPWTWRLRPDHADRGGERVFLPDLVAARREELVIKHARSLGGTKVHLGRFTPEPSWQEIVRAALEEGSWVVQDFVEAIPYAYQSGDSGWEPHEVVWGLFVFGSRFGGGFVRLLPKSVGGVVNTARGAEVSVLVEVGTPAEADSATALSSCPTSPIEAAPM